MTECFDRPKMWRVVLYQVALTATMVAMMPTSQVDAHDQRSCCNINCYDPGLATCPQPRCVTLDDPPVDMFDSNCRNCKCSTSYCRWRFFVAGECQLCDYQPRWTCSLGSCDPPV
jgi:hypothetical protein